MKRPPYIQISIPEPCQQKWEEMSAVDGGRHCDHCDHVVIDFTTWTDRELYEFFASNRSHVCGRYLSTQLDRPIHIPYQPHSRLYRMVVAMGLTLIFGQVTSSYAQQKTQTTLSPTNANKAGVAAYQGGAIKGQVIDEKREPMISASVQVFKDGILRGGAVTDYDGSYTIGPLGPGEYKVVIQFSGYNSDTIDRVVVTDTVVTINAEMKVDHTYHPTIQTVVWGRPPLQSYHKHLKGRGKETMQKQKNGKKKK